ncbi:MAG TPA: hypothetical protein VJ987_14485 [Anaerolineales bacterium]|nr:hypothetical protein [Anaerolineales bacterium]
MSKLTRWLLVSVLGVILYILLGLIDLRTTSGNVQYAWLLLLGLWITFAFFLLREKPN